MTTAAEPRKKPGGVRRVDLNAGKAGTKPKYRYRYRTVIGRDPRTGKAIEANGSHRSYDDAKRAYDKAVAARSAKSAVKGANITVNAWLDEVSPTLIAGMGDAVAANFRHMSKHVRAHLGGTTLREMNESDVTKLRDILHTRGRRTGGQPGTALGLRTTRSAISVFAELLEPAVSRQLIPRNYAQNIVVSVVTERSARLLYEKDQAEAAAKSGKKSGADPDDAPYVSRTPARVKGAPADTPPWSMDEARLFLKAIRHDVDYPIYVMSFMGLRPEEVTGLRWPEVDRTGARNEFGLPTLRIMRVAPLVDGKRIERETAKTYAGVRTLPLPTFLVNALGELLTRQDADAENAGPSIYPAGPDRYVYASQLGEPRKMDYMRRRFYRLCDLTETRRVKPYSARKSVLSFLANKVGVKDTILQEWAGHSDVSVTKRFYIHTTVDDLRVASDALDAALG